MAYKKPPKPQIATPEAGGAKPRVDKSNLTTDQTLSKAPVTAKKIPNTSPFADRKKVNADLAGFKKDKRLQSWAQSAFATPEGPWMSRARRLIAAYNGRYHKAYMRKNRFVINTVFSVVQLLLPNLIFGPTHIRVKPKNAKYDKTDAQGNVLGQIDAVAAARIREASINHEVTKIDALAEMRKAVLDSFFYGFGICKSGWSTSTMTELDTSYLVQDCAFHKRVNPPDFGWHPMATDMSDSPFFAHRIYLPKDTAMSLYGVDTATIEEMQSEVPKHIKDRLELEKKNRKGYTDSSFEDYVALIELHSLQDNKLFLYTGDGSKQVRDGVDNPYDFNGTHFTRIKFAGDNEMFEGVPLISTIEDQSLVLNELFTLVIEHLRKFPSQLFVNKGAVDEDDLERIRAGEQGSIHLVNDYKGINAVSPVSLGNDYPVVLRMINDIVDKTLGLPDFQMRAGSGRKSATEASIIHGDATTRLQYYLQLVKQFVLDGVHRIGWLQQQYQDKREDIMVAGDPYGDPISYDKTDIQGDFIFDFDVEDLQASNEVQLNSLINLIGVLSKSPVTAPVLQSLNPFKLGDALFQRSGLNIEAFEWSPHDTPPPPSPAMMAATMQQSAMAAGGMTPGGAPPAPNGLPPGQMGPGTGPAGPNEPVGPVQ